MTRSLFFEIGTWLLTLVLVVALPGGPVPRRSPDIAET